MHRRGTAVLLDSLAARGHAAAGRSNLDAHVAGPPSRRAHSVRMLLSFQRPTRLRGRGLLLDDAPGSPAAPRAGSGV